jgi:protein-S-isoprenylcysteine O-methyltransferase Ste14
VSEPIHYRLVVGGLMLACGWVVGSQRLRQRKSAGSTSRAQVAARAPSRSDVARASGVLTAAARAAGALLSVVALLYVIYPTAVQLGAVALSAPLRWCGLIPAAAGLVLMRSSLISLGRNFTDTAGVHPDGGLVTSGPYKTIRHPYYAAAALLMLATSLLSANVLLALAALVVWGLLWCRLPAEERALEAAFGDQYRIYAARTGRFFPRLGR